MDETTHQILLVGHGGVPSDFPREKLLELKRLEGARRAKGERQSEREKELDRELRHWPRSAKTDPYQEGLEALRAALERRAGRKVVAAFNEFCAPSIEVAVDRMVASGASGIDVMSSMLTRGGSHAELEVPEALASCRRRHPHLALDYHWPFEVDRVAEMMIRQLNAPTDDDA